MRSTNEATLLVIRKCIARPYSFRRAICPTRSYSLLRALIMYYLILLHEEQFNANEMTHLTRYDVLTL